MKNLIKLGLLSVITASVFSACFSEPKSVEYYKNPKNAQELEEKVKECKKYPESELNLMLIKHNILNCLKSLAKVQ